MVQRDNLIIFQLGSFRNNLLWESRSACFTHEMLEDHYTTNESGLTPMNTEEIHEPGLSGSPPLTNNQLWTLTFLRSRRLQPRSMHSTSVFSLHSTSVRARRRGGARLNSNAAAWWMYGVGSGLSGWTAFKRNPDAR
ncbi:uncharacterized protein LOC119275101 isoform X2 [Triticum dicoccoides]|uniref:uncharacterized protein LOC119275101 isoform X2 n=1 Tax=Triticum dicoccoides TaxID=85692 RepID=UPI00188F1D78|nr:uncharacterized protein LOC119275101 isoform X2 [Triticum dicoccoides]